MRRLPEGLTEAAVTAAVRERYGRVASDPAQQAGFPVGRDFAEAVGYPPELLASLPPDAAAAFAGVACPVPHAHIVPGERVLDLGCGGGLDSLFAGRMTGPRGHVAGIDFAPEMIERAQRSITAAAMPWVHVQLADGACLPLATASVDVVIVNGIFNLNPHRQALLDEAVRVLRPGGRMVAAEIVLTAPLPPGEGHSLDDWFR